tara:strand:- start:3172 stop:4350 length:1179 start_codon:yes stop_codon:yes gene_type:complete
MKKSIFISTGEVSGDLHGGLLARELLKESERRCIELELYGLGGEKMKEAGVKIIYDTTPISAIGIWEAIPLILPMMKIQKRFLQMLVSKSPNCLILIDYMGPNISIGKRLKRKNLKMPIYYYIAPQEWAWRVGNNSTTDLIGFSDKIFAIFQQEANFYKKRGGRVSWIGHPMVDLTEKLPTKKESREYLNLGSNKNILLIMPASRPQELRYVLPTFMKTAKKLQRKYPNLVIFIPSCRKEFDEIFQKSLEKYNLKGRVISMKDIKEYKTYVYALSKLALCKSGTVNMELALYNIPQVVGYKVSRVTAFIAIKILNFKVRFISPVNLLVKKLVIPEFVQKDFNVDSIFRKSCKIIENKNEKIKIKEGYKLLKKNLGDAGVAKRAAVEILNSLI